MSPFLLIFMKRIHFEEIDSTNSYIKREYSNLDNLTFVSTSFQSEGHGRYSRKWYSNKGENIMFSYLIKDINIINHFSYVSMFSAALVVKYLENKGLKNVTIKWPNDVYVNDKKICGMLLEGIIPSYVVVGIGVNLNQTSFNDNELRHAATSVKLEMPDVLFDAHKETDEIINIFSSFWYSFNGNWNDFDDFIKSHNYLLNKKVMVETVSTSIEGVVVDIDSQCNLIVDTGLETLKINSGEVKIL